jgi:hypothetical protein
MSVPQASLHSLLYSHSMPSSQPLCLVSDNLTAGSALVAQHLRPQIRERSQKHRTHLHFLTRVRFISPILRTATCAWFPTSLLPPVCACAGVSLSGPKSLGRRGWQAHTHAKVGEARGYEWSWRSSVHSSFVHISIYSCFLYRVNSPATA